MALHAHVPPESLTVRGFVALLVEGLNGARFEEILQVPNDLVDRVLWTAPSAKVLINSPAVQVLRWAQAQFPALYPGGVIDTHPLIAPPRSPSPLREAQ